MKYIVSRYNHDLNWLKDYTDDAVVYDRSDETELYPGAIQVPNIGTDITDKFNFIIDNYDNLPEIAIYTKANIFKYISKQEFDLIKDNNVFTPILTQKHQITEGVSHYKDGLYWEINNGWYLTPHPVKSPDRINPIMEMLGIKGMRYVPFAPGSNYIVPKENILKHPKAKYEKFVEYMKWARYPGEAQIIERGLYTLWS